jgi:hypothetical protein
LTERSVIRVDHLNFGEEQHQKIEHILPLSALGKRFGYGGDIKTLNSGILLLFELLCGGEIFNNQDLAPANHLCSLTYASVVAYLSAVDLKGEKFL